MENSEQASSLLAHPGPDFSFLPTTTILVYSKTALCIESHISRLSVLTASSQIQGQQTASSSTSDCFHLIVLPRSPAQSTLPVTEQLPVTR